MKKYQALSVFLLAVLCLSPFGWAQDRETGQAEVLPPPDIPEPPQSGEPVPGPQQDEDSIEPEVTIRQKENSTVEEYRLNGNLYMVKIMPAVGPAYYLIDRDGDGRMEFRTGRLGDDFTPPQWLLFEW